MTIAHPPTHVPDVTDPADTRAGEVASRPRIDPKKLMGVVDLATVALSLALNAFVTEEVAVESGPSRWRFLVLGVATLPAWLAILSGQRLYNTRFIGRRIDEFRRIVNATFLGTLAVAAGRQLRRHPARRGRARRAVPRRRAVVVTIEREIARRIFLRLRGAGPAWSATWSSPAPTPRAATSPPCSRPSPGSATEVLGFVDDDAPPTREPVPGVPLLGGVADAAEHPPGTYPNASVIVAASAVESAPPTAWPATCSTRASTSSCRRRSATSPRSASPSARSAASRSSTSSRSPAAAGGPWPSARSTSSAPASGSLLTAPILARRPPSPSSSTRRARCSSARSGWAGTAEPFQVLKLRTMVRRRRGPPGRAAWTLNEADGPLFKMARRPPHHPGRPVPPQDLDRRAAPALERAPGRDEPRRPPARPAPRDRGVGRAAHPAPAGQARHHRHVAGQRPQRHHASRTTRGSTSTTSTTGRSPTDLAILAKTVPVVLLRQGAR